MNSTAADLQAAAYLIHHSGLHTGTHFANATDAYGALDVCAAVYAVAEGNIPNAFYDDECASLDLIEASDRAMDAIRAVSAALDTAPCETNGVPDYIEHVSNWAATPPIGATQPPTTSEVIGRILRAADNQPTSPRLGFTDAWGVCLTCGGHGTLTTDGEEIPYGELSPRRKQGYDLGHRFHRNTSKTCPDCDGQDRVTDAAVSAHEATL
ncbi:hypothetical protein KVH31_35015 [Streptomyces olivaceus]|uniref:DUF6197 family protein n=1 Tax=Streptomyces olivaceus TaxID=47716 RepID=UPI001CCCF00A|nr:hypothetical protein [Streptomyces olivaceus]MBZ6211710.1 hypothetical protein [Streptomyces olivaceus]